MLPNRILAVACIAIPAGALASIGCGVIAFPVEGPKIAVVNTKLISFTVDIVDEQGQPLPGVTTQATTYAIAPDFLFVETGESKPEALRTVDGVLKYTTFGNYAVLIEYSKPGYIGRRCLYALCDNVKIVPRAAFLMMPRPQQPPDEQINTFKQPRSKVILKKEDGTSQ